MAHGCPILPLLSSLLGAATASGRYFHPDVPGPESKSRPRPWWASRGDAIEVRTLAELGSDDDAVLRVIHAVDMSTAKDMPSAESYSIPFDEWRTALTAQPGVSFASIWIAIHGGRVIGLAVLRRQGHDAAWHDGLGVEREFRGRGVARLLKLHALEWARANGVRFLYTGNDVDNPRIWAINERLGYRPLPNRIEIVRALAASHP